MSEIFIGMISGTSVDGVDCVTVDFAGNDCRILAAKTFPYPEPLRVRFERLIRSPEASLAEIGSLDVAAGRFFAECVLAQLGESGLDAAQVVAIGHHGQTVFHQPEGPEPFTMQLGDASVVAAITRIPTVASIRHMDMALGGQGAPMVPAFHKWRFASADEPRVIVNIGGIANITTLDRDKDVIGFDTGPGNTLMNLWTERWRGKAFDANGDWAASGRPLPAMLDAMLADEYFALAPPKSTGRERFNQAWLDAHLETAGGAADPADVQATLAELTAVSIARAVTELKLASARLIVCGGGAHNAHLLQRLRAHHEGEVSTTADAGLDPDWVEAVAFAWLARARIRNEPGNLVTVTGAREAAVLGGLYFSSTR